MKTNNESISIEEMDMTINKVSPYWVREQKVNAVWKSMIEKAESKRHVFPMMQREKTTKIEYKIESSNKKKQISLLEKFLALCKLK